MPRTPRIALTGGIGAGKSTVAALFVRRGAALIDADAIARELTGAGGAAIEALRAAFGAQMLDAGGALDRARMRALVFADAGARARLEAILHPLILERCRAQAQDRESSAPLLLFDVPLLAESSAARQALAADRVLVIDCPQAQQIARASARGTIPAGQIEAVIASQAPRRQRLDIADDVLVNAGTLDDLAIRVARLWGEYVCGVAV